MKFQHRQYEHELIDHWVDAHVSMGIRGNPIVCRDIYDAYNTDSRHYHGIMHLVAVLSVIDQLMPEASAERGLAKLILFFHDLDMSGHGGGESERLSANKFREYSEQVGLVRSEISRGEAIIMATADHQNSDCDDPLWANISDADLAIFAAPRPVYQKYANDVWLEYEHVGRAAFVAGRIAFLENFKQKPIFKVMVYHNDKAIANIDSELEMLAA